MPNVAREWLARLCQTHPGARRAVLLRSNDAESLEPVAAWPEGNDTPRDLAGAAHAAQRHQRPVVAAKGPKGSQESAGYVALPFRLPSGGSGALAFELEDLRSDPRGAVQWARHGLTWLEALERQSARQERVVSVLDLMGLALEHEAAHDAAVAISTALAARLGMERVSIGFRVRGATTVDAISNAATFDARALLVRDLGVVMDEACDQDSTLVWPSAEDGPLRVTRAHESFAREQGSGALCTIPLVGFDQVIGAICFEASPGTTLSPATVETCEDLAALLGPLLHLRRAAERGWLERARQALRRRAEQLFGPGHPEAKLATTAAAALLAVLLLVPGEYRVAADASLEGRVRRAIVAGIEGYIGEANVRPGDLVQRGQILGRLDERDLALEQRKWQGQRDEVRTEQREALASHDRARRSVLSAKLAQAEAQLALIEEQLARTRLVAPFDGVVVRGDLSQALGSPVEKGDVLFEIAPLDGYRIILHIDERDIRDVNRGARGELVLSALPDRPLPLIVERVTPVTVAEDGRNTFRAEALLEEPIEGLRPGMEGLAKLDAGSRSLLWIWTHDIQDWLRLSLWSWLP